MIWIYETNSTPFDFLLPLKIFIDKEVSVDLIR